MIKSMLIIILKLYINMTKNIELDILLNNVFAY